MGGSNPPRPTFKIHKWGDSLTGKDAKHTHLLYPVISTLTANISFLGSNPRFS